MFELSAIPGTSPHICRSVINQPSSVLASSCERVVHVPPSRRCCVKPVACPLQHIYDREASPQLSKARGGAHSASRGALRALRAARPVDLGASFVLSAGTRAALLPLHKSRVVPSRASRVMPSRAGVNIPCMCLSAADAKCIICRWL